MAVTAFVLITTLAKEIGSTLEALRKSDSVRTATAVTGPYDIIATVEAEDVATLGQVITRVVHSIPGIERTISCIDMEL